VLDGDPNRALLEICDGKYWDGGPAAPGMLDGFYFVELDNDRIRDGVLMRMLSRPRSQREKPARKRTSTEPSRSWNELVASVGLSKRMVR
jgi:hypothetical protein